MSVTKIRLALDSDTFAAERKEILARADERLGSVVTAALVRRGIPGWDDPVVSAALAVFDETVRSEVDELGPNVEELRKEFERELRAALAKTKSSRTPAIQAENITRWISAMSVNAGTEAATTSDPDPMVGLEWVSMEDKEVRASHKEAHGQIVPTGQAFTVGGVEIFYPGQPVGDPSVWYNCRCVARPTMRSEFATKTGTFAAEPGLADLQKDKATVEEKKITTSVIVALPKQGDPVELASSEDQAHCTLLFLGESSEFDPTDIKASLAAYAESFAPEPFEEGISGSATLGEEGAMVVLLDAPNLAQIRGALLQDGNVRARHDQVEQYPSWIPHLTLGYPDNPPPLPFEGKGIAFDRIALWHGGEKEEYTLAPKVEIGGESEPLPADTVVAAAIEDDPPIIPDDASGLDPEVDPGPPEMLETDFPPVPFHGVLCPVGVTSGDGRQFSDSMVHRRLPLTLKWMPADAPEHGGSVAVGRIDRIFQDGNLIKTEGEFDLSGASYEAIRQIANEIIRGVSVDVDNAKGRMGEDDVAVYDDARISSATLCTIPAFPEAFVALGRWEDEEVEEAGEIPEEEPDDGSDPGAEAREMASTFAPVPTKTKDGPGWITEPEATKKITDYWVDGVGAAKIGWGAPNDFNRCRVQLAKYVQNPEWLAGLCANLHYRALRTWPGNHGGKAMVASGHHEDETYRTPDRSEDTVTAAAMTLVDTRPVLSADWFRDPQLTEPTPLTITDQGEVFGHIADWSTCHIGYPSQCKTASHSITSYAYFLTGAVRTDAGIVPVGQITLGGGHADLNMNMKAAMSHYDSTSTAVADIMVGEDAHGIWFHGALRHNVTEDDRHALLAASLSGDWRGVYVKGRKNAEMIAAHATNVPGFGIPRFTFSLADGDVQSMVAAGVVENTRPTVDPNFRAQLAAVRAEEERSKRAEAVRASARARRLATVRAKIQK